jgi:FkbM family methyltransferase
MIEKMIDLFEKFPLVSFFAYEFLARMPFLLPHDKSYLIFPHLMPKEHGLILDVGANNGISSVYFHKIKPPWKIMAIEPNAFHRYSMERLKRKFKNFEYHMIGLSNQSGKATFFTPTYFGIPLHAATSSKLAHFDCLKVYPAFIRKKLKFKQQEVVVKTLDELNVRPDVIKFDCEGMDLEILRGAVETLRSCRPYVLLENHRDSYLDLVSFCEKISMGVFFYDFCKNRLIKTEQSLTTDERNEKNLVMIPLEKIEEIKLRIPIVYA